MAMVVLQSSFFSQQKWIFYRMLLSGQWKWILCLVFVYSERTFLLVETIIQIKVKPFLQSNLSPTIGSHFLHVFQLFLRVKAAFARSENVSFQQILPFSWCNQNFCLSETVFFYLQLFFCLWKPLLTLNSVSTQPKIRISLKNTFPLDGKKIAGVSEKWEKNGFHYPEKQLSTRRISSFSQNCFLLIPIIVSTQ